METIPPTQNILLQHCKRVAYQAGIWMTSDLAYSKHPLQKDLAGHWTVKPSHGFLYGLHYLCPQNLTVNLSSVWLQKWSAKVLARRSALNCAVVKDVRTQENF